MIKSLALLLTMSLLAPSTKIAAESPKVYTVHLPEAEYFDYLDMLDGRDPLEIEDISRVAKKRMLIEPLIFQVAPVLGGCHCQVKYAVYEVKETPHARSIEQVRRGVEISHGVAGFADDSRYGEGIALSLPILKREDFYVGFYTHEDREDVLSLSADEDIRNLRFAVGYHWEIDNLMLAKNQFEVVTADTWNSLVKLIKLGRADVVLQPFTPSEKQVFIDTTTQLKLKPIPGVKMRFGQGRHYFVSTKHPDGPEFLKALNRGLELLESENKLYEAMEYAGVINKEAESFRIFGEP